MRCDSMSCAKRAFLSRRKTRASGLDFRGSCVTLSTKDVGSSAVTVRVKRSMGKRSRYWRMSRYVLSACGIRTTPLRRCKKHRLMASSMRCSKGLTGPW